MSTASRRCMVFKCGRTSKDRHLSFHSFPKRKDIRDQWVLNIKLGQPDWSIPKYSSSKYYAICSRHFELGCFRTVKHKFDMASRNTLKPDAVPTLYMDGKSSSTLDRSFPLNRNPLTEPVAVSERLERMPTENGNVQNKMHSVEEDVVSTQEVANSASLLPAGHYCESASSLYVPAHSGQTILGNTNMDERSPRKYALASRRCMVFGCGSTSRNRNLSFHAFPKKPELREEWLRRIKVNRPNWSQNWPESNYYAVCSRHFTQECFKTMKHNFCATSRNTLRPDAVPSLYLTGKPDPTVRCNSTLDFAQQHESSPVLHKHIMLNCDDESGSFQESSECQELVEEDDDGCWISPSFTSCITELHSENRSWSPEEVDFADASTQTVSTEQNTEPKQTRTVRVQTIITIRKSLESKETQYDLPKTTNEATNCEQCANQMEDISSELQKLHNSVECYQSQKFESDCLNPCT